MEHINRLVKIAIEGLGANKSKKAIERVAKGMGILSEVTKSFDSKVGIATPSRKHSDPKIAQDVKCLTEQLIDSNIFNLQKSTYLQFLPSPQEEFNLNIRRREPKELDGRVVYALTALLISTKRIKH